MATELKYCNRCGKMKKEKDLFKIEKKQNLLGAVITILGEPKKKEYEYICKECSEQ